MKVLTIQMSLAIVLLQSVFNLEVSWHFRNSLVNSIKTKNLLIELFKISLSAKRAQCADRSLGAKRRRRSASSLGGVLS